MVTEHKCNSCFYMQHERDKHPCNVCEGYNKYVNRNIYIHQPLSQAIKEWDFDEDNNTYYSSEYNVVSKPKHYMLFEDLGIEVRDVIEKLIQKIKTEANKDDYPQGYSKPLFIPDYVQMMQYLMRFMDKNGVEDLKKARWYLDKLIEAYDGTDN